MNCCRPSRSKKYESSPKTATMGTSSSTPQKSDSPKPKPNEEILLRIPGATLHLMEDGETAQLAEGELTVVRLTQENVVLATIVKVGNDIQWPLTKDEPVVKVDELHYLFSLPSGAAEGDFLNYGVSFSKPNSGLAMLDMFLKENSCFSSPSNNLDGSASANATASALSSKDSPGVYWKDYAPKVEDYNNILAKAIAQGTGEIIKGIFKCSNAYAKQVQSGGDMIRAKNVNRNTFSSDVSKSNKNGAGKKKGGIQTNIRRVRTLSKMTEKISKSILDGIAHATGSVAKPLIQSQAGKAFLSSVPGEVLLASLNAVDKVIDAVEAAERQAFSATSGAVTGMVARRYGEDAGEMTGDVLATAGHAAGTAWNIFKIRKAINPANSLPKAAVKNAIKKH